MEDTSTPAKQVALPKPVETAVPIETRHVVRIPIEYADAGLFLLGVITICIGIVASRNR